MGRFLIYLSSKIAILAEVQPTEYIDRLSGLGPVGPDFASDRSPITAPENNIRLAILGVCVIPGRQRGDRRRPPLIAPRQRARARWHGGLLQRMRMAASSR